VRASNYYNNMNYSHFIKIIYLNPETEGQSAGTHARIPTTPTLYNIIQYFINGYYFLYIFSPISHRTRARAVLIFHFHARAPLQF